MRFTKSIHMNAEIRSIIYNLKEVLSGNPWYGKSALTLFNEIDPALAYQKPDQSHSLIDLLYHMVTWAAFTQHRLMKDRQMDSDTVEALDWREINPAIHTWENGVAQFTEATNAIIQLLEASSDQLLEEKVDYREYNFLHLLNGLVQHNIYHLGQIAYVNKLL